MPIPLFDGTQRPFHNVSGLATRSGDRTARVLVGRKGSGKTVYLRRLHADAAKQHAIFAAKIDQRPPETETIIEFCQYFRADVVREKWIALWHAALMRTVVSQLVNEPALRDSVPSKIRDSLRSDFKSLLGQFRVAVTPFSQVGQIVAAHRSANSLNNCFRDPAWAEIDGMVEQALANCSRYASTSTELTRSSRLHRCTG
jgi:hypothetical protein